MIKLIALHRLTNVWTILNWIGCGSFRFSSVSTAIMFEGQWLKCKKSCKIWVVLKPDDNDVSKIRTCPDYRYKWMSEIQTAKIQTMPKSEWKGVWNSDNLDLRRLGF